jgi:predicted RNA-binding protein YlxR (DUF448 family)
MTKLRRGNSRPPHQGEVRPARQGGGDTPERQCAVTRQRLPQEQMVRFALSPSGEVTPDILARLPGRGVWLTASREAVIAAGRQKAFARGFGEAVAIPDRLDNMVETLLVRRCAELIGLARKAGQAVSGFGPVRDALRKGAPALLLEAADGAPDGRQKVQALARALYGRVPVAGALSADELGQAFGRASTVHGLLHRGALAKSFAAVYQRLLGFRPAPELDWFGGPGSDTKQDMPG